MLALLLALVKFKQKITGKAADAGTTDVETIISLKCLSNFWKTSEMYLINFEVNLILTWRIQKHNVRNDWYKKCSSCNFINSRYYKTIATIEIRF